MPLLRHLILFISIHTPTRGATDDNISRSKSYLFQSTLPRGERRYEERSILPGHGISIHTPTRGATTSAKSSLAVIDDFNPHSRVGSDRCSWQNSGTIYKFQSTLPRGERQLDSIRNSQIHYFNPHSRVGSDNRTECMMR